jgi:large conductance mechanosensitive channel
MLKEFREFIMKGNLVDIAVGLILALAFAGVVSAFTDGIIGGIIGVIFSGAGFDAWNIHTSNGSTIAIGSFVGEIVNFVIVGFILFLIVRAYNRIRRPEMPAPPTDVELLVEIRDELRARRI